ncbi:hypothetical protein BDV28DRAFT_150610 [Aspergillus coremiiformis]|uniref:Uncharacterized protein n=1 Tax=Aspergillus coremiiformis TaxID=138285 RepID=A0A5N6YZD4_9EURO|nr:hypothetical protein BDV28DRAFT_150610 [Aspergillus coremiiformis]
MKTGLLSVAMLALAVSALTIPHDDPATPAVQASDADAVTNVNKTPLQKRNPIWVYGTCSGRSAKYPDGVCRAKRRNRPAWEQDWEVPCAPQTPCTMTGSCVFDQRVQERTGGLVPKATCH